jgi:RNA polymerase sigma-70 factor (ECF subfamily)
MVLSHEDANDLLQNTFIKAWTNIDYFRAEAKLSTWLYRIALNECLTFLNRQRATTTVAIDDPEAAIVQKLESDPYYSGDQVQMLLQKALLTLPEKQRMVFNLKYYQEMKYEEMSEIFGTSGERQDNLRDCAPAVHNPECKADSGADGEWNCGGRHT